MSDATPTEAQWRAVVERELGGAPFEKALVLQALEGVAIAPLYTSRPSGTFRELRPGAVKVCMRYGPQTAAEDVGSGAEALWLEAEAVASAPSAALIVDAGALPAVAAAERVAPCENAVLCVDPLSTGVVYCELVCALQGLAQYDLAEEWTNAMERWSATNAIGSIHG